MLQHTTTRGDDCQGGNFDWDRAPPFWPNYAVVNFTNILRAAFLPIAKKLKQKLKAQKSWTYNVDEIDIPDRKKIGEMFPKLPSSSKAVKKSFDRQPSVLQFSQCQHILNKTIGFYLATYLSFLFLRLRNYQEHFLLVMPQHR